MTVSAQTPERRLLFATAIYGALSIALVVVDWEGDGNEWHLVEVIAGYVITMWATHTYAALVTTGELRRWSDVARHEFPVAAAGLPALAIAVIGQALSWKQEETADLALIACAVTLVAIQVKLVRQLGRGRNRVISTVAVDMLLAAIIVTLHITI